MDRHARGRHMSRARGADELVMAAQSDEIVGIGHVRVVATQVRRGVTKRLDGDVVDYDVAPDSPRRGAYDRKAIITRLAATAIRLAASSRAARSSGAGRISPLVIADEAEVSDDLVASAASPSAGRCTAGTYNKPVIHAIVPAHAERNARRRCGASVDSDIVQARVYPTTG